MNRVRRRRGELEALLLTILRACGPMTPKQLHEAIGGDTAYTTVYSTLVRLCDKQAIRRVRLRGRPAYAAIKDAAQDAADRMLEVLRSACDRLEVLSYFITCLDPVDRQTLRRLVNHRPNNPRLDDISY